MTYQQKFSLKTNSDQGFEARIQHVANKRLHTQLDFAASEKKDKKYIISHGECIGRVTTLTGKCLVFSIMTCDD